MIESAKELESNPFLLDGNEEWSSGNSVVEIVLDVLTEGRMVHYVEEKKEWRQRKNGGKQSGGKERMKETKE